VFDDIFSGKDSFFFFSAYNPKGQIPSDCSINFGSRSKFARTKQTIRNGRVALANIQAAHECALELFLPQTAGHFLKEAG